MKYKKGSLIYDSKAGTRYDPETGFVQLDKFSDVVHKRLSKNHYTMYEIYDMNGGMYCFVNMRLRAVLAHLMTRIPKNYVDRIIEENVFIMSNADLWMSSYVNHQFITGKSLILLPEKLFEKPHRVSSILADIMAYAYLRLYPRAKTYEGRNSENARQGLEADRLVKKWGLK